jgi:hypothetical protein
MIIGLKTIMIHRLDVLKNPPLYTSIEAPVNSGSRLRLLDRNYYLTSRGIAGNWLKPPAMQNP